MSERFESIRSTLKRLMEDPERPVLRRDDGRIVSPHTVLRRRSVAAGTEIAAAGSRRQDGALHFGPYGYLTPVVPLRRELPEDSPQRFPGGETLAAAIAAVEPDFRPFPEGETWWIEAGEREDGTPVLMACDFYLVTRSLAFAQLQDALELLEEADEEPDILPMWVWGTFSRPAPN